MSRMVPELRFPEFTGDWRTQRLSAVLKSKGKRNKDLRFGPEHVLSVSGELGVVNQIEHLGRSYAGASVAPYHIVETDDIVYTKSPLKANPFGIIKVNRGAAGIVSTLYAVYEVRTGHDPIFWDRYFELDDRTNRYLKPLVNKGAKNDMKISNERVLIDPVIAPALDEQQKIAAFLDATSRKITLLTDKKTALEDYKRGLMQRLFSRELRFTRDDGSPFPAWEERKLSSLLKEHKQKSDGTEAVHSVSVVHGLIDQVAHLGRSYAAETTLHYNRVNPGDIVYTKSPTGKFPFGIIKQSQIAYSAIVSPLYGVFRPKTHQIGMFLDVYFSSESNTERFLRPLVNKGAKNTMNINNSTFLSGKVWVPVDPDEIQKIRDLFSSIDKKTLCLSTKISDMEAFKKGLLQKLFV